MFYSSGNILKFKPRLKLWKSGSVQWDPILEEAWSYNWCFVKRINGKLVFNEYRYSPTTTNHQYAIRALFRELKIKVDLTIDTSKSLTDSTAALGALDSAIRLAVKELAPWKYAENIAKTFKVPLTNSKIEQVIEAMEIEVCEAYLNRAFKYHEDKFQAILNRLGAPRYIPTVSNDSTNTQSEVFPWAA